LQLNISSELHKICAACKLVTNCAQASCFSNSDKSLTFLNDKKGTQNAMQTCPSYRIVYGFIYTFSPFFAVKMRINRRESSTKKARLVGRGDMMIPWVDFDPNAVYCGIVAASSIKMARVIDAMYMLLMRGGDLVGAYLITLANPKLSGTHLETSRLQH
jgi:hypothetical protein